MMDPALTTPTSGPRVSRWQHHTEREEPDGELQSDTQHRDGETRRRHQYAAPSICGAINIMRKGIQVEFEQRNRRLSQSGTDGAVTINRPIQQ